MTRHSQDPVVIGSFTILGRLGRGAMGAVYLARSLGGRLVAVKVVRDELAGDSAFRARFAREINAARKVSGAFTAAVVDADPDAERPWMATEYLPGSTLQKTIETSGPMTPGAVHALAGGLAEALMAIHASGVVHRDLKPSNIVLTDNGPRVIDFGIARALEDASLTATGMVIGTPGYLSPEQITGTTIGPPSDVFALGSVLVFAVSGQGPFAHGNPASLLHRVIHEQPQIPALPSPLQDVVRRCLVRDPAQRPTPPDILQLLGVPVPQTLVLPPPGTKLLVEQPQPPTLALQPPPVHQQPPVHHHAPAQPSGAAFTTSRTRPAIVATITTLLVIGFTPQDRETNIEYPVLSVFFGLFALFCLYFAIRNWPLVLRRRVVLHLSPQGLTIERGRRRGQVPWNGVTRLRVGGSQKRPWLIVWLEAPYQSALPAPGRRHHGGLRIYPIAHGRTANRRIRQLDELRAALNWYAGGLHDNSY